MRILLSIPLVLIFFTSLAVAQTAPVRIILVGDSTVAPVNGWGPGFCRDVTAQVACVNMAKNGRSTRSYREEGSWKEVMDALGHNGEFSATWVFIQFGHNDQPGKPKQTPRRSSRPICVTTLGRFERLAHARC
jgi:lysophospholipase L1-like esterase